MFSRLLGGAIGALVTFVLLWFNHADPASWATAAIVGAVVAFVWPMVTGLGRRRARSRRETEIEAEVQRRITRQTDDIPPR